MTKIALVSEMPEPEAFAALEAEGYIVCVGTIEMEPGRNVNADYYPFDADKISELKGFLSDNYDRQFSAEVTGTFHIPLSALKEFESNSAFYEKNFRKHAAAFALAGTSLAALLRKNIEAMKIQEKIDCLREDNNRRYAPLVFPEYKPEKNFSPKGKAPIPQKYKRNRFSR